MSAAFDWEEDNGTQTGSPTKGTTRTVSRAEQNWKNIDDSTTAYGSSSITQGNNSFDKWTFGKFSGTFNSISALLWAHTVGAMGTGLTIKGKVAPAGGYTTPAVAANANLSVDMTSAIAIGSGQAVQVGATGPEAAGKATSSTANPSYTDWLTHQLQTTSSASAGDTATATFALQYNEN